MAGQAADQTTRAAGWLRRAEAAAETGLQHVGHGSGWDRVAVEGAPDSFSARYHARDGTLVGALLANRPDEVASVRRELAGHLLAA